MDKTASSDGDRQHAPVIFGICALVTAVFLLLQGMGFVPLKEAEGYLQDWSARLGRKTPVNPQLVLIGIDRPSYDDVILADEAKADPVLAALRERYPWSRAVWAALIERLADAGAKTIVIDLLFAAHADGDEDLRAALDKFREMIVIGSDFNPVETDRGTMTRLAVPNPTLIPDTADHPAALDARVGFVTIWLDDDNVIRRAKFRATNEELGYAIESSPKAVIESLDARALRSFGASKHIPPGTSSHRF